MALHATGEAIAPKRCASARAPNCCARRRSATGLLAPDDAPAIDGVISEAAVTAIETLLERALNVPEPSEDACRRHYTANEAAYRTGERIRARHILFAVTPGIDVVALRKRASRSCSTCAAMTASRATASLMRRASGPTAPAAREGGDLGRLVAADCAPEFARELFGHAEIGVLPRLVHSRFGLHVVEVLEREPGVAQPFESVRGAVAMALRQQAYVTALRQYLQPAGRRGTVEGVDLDAADTPLVQ